MSNPPPVAPPTDVRAGVPADLEYEIDAFAEAVGPAAVARLVVLMLF